MRSPYQKTMYACFIGYIVQAVVNNFVPLLFVTFQKTYQISLSKITFLITIKAIPHKERLATFHAICLQIFLQSLFRIFSHASCVHIFRDISGKYSKIHKGFSPFFPSSLKKSDDAICIRQIRNRLSYFTKMLVNTSSIHSAFCFI